MEIDLSWLELECAGEGGVLCRTIGGGLIREGNQCGEHVGDHYFDLENHAARALLKGGEVEKMKLDSKKQSSLRPTHCQEIWKI